MRTRGAGGVPDVPGRGRHAGGHGLSPFTSTPPRRRRFAWGIGRLQELRPMLEVQSLIAAADLGDPQRNARVHTLVLDLIRGAGAAARGVATGTAAPWAHTMGAHRFFH